MRCLSCHYDLKKLSENRCPECGRAFDPDDPTTVAPSPMGIGECTLIGSGGVFILAWLATSILYSIGHPYRGIDWSLGLVPGMGVTFAFTPVILIALIIRAKLRNKQDS